MAKTIAEKLTNSKQYRTEYGDRILSESELTELTTFNVEIGFNYHRIATLVKFIKQGHTDWVSKWDKLKSLTSSNLELQILLYGVEEGNSRYLEMNTRKTAHLDHSPEHQRAANRASIAKTKGSKTHSVRGIGYWVMSGLTVDEATVKVQQIQSTNSLSRYINQYGDIDGPIKFEERKIQWKEKMADPVISKKRSLGLWRYIERYGETEGKQKYLTMRRTRNENSRIGKASSESIIAFSEIIKLLDNNSVKYYFGVVGNKEWFIYDNILERPFFYDLTIPSLSIIIEYHGEAYHPNPKWKDIKWNEWKCLFNNKSADKVYLVDQYKKKLAENSGWCVYEIYSSEVETSQRVIIEDLTKLGYAL